MKRLYDKALMDQIAKVYGNEVTFLSEFSRALLDIIREGLIRDGQVRLHQFGTFKLKWMKSRNGVNPSTGEKIIIQARPRVIFVAAKALKERIEPNPPALQPFDHVEKVESSEEVQTKNEDEEITHLGLGDELDSILDNTVFTEVENDIRKDKIKVTEPEEVVADIQDEIEVLEQVVDLLKTETTAVIDTTPVQEGTSSEWLDQSVVESIKDISELQYFKKTENQQVEQIAEENTPKDAAISGTLIPDQKDNVELDINLDSLSQLPGSNDKQNKEKSSGKAWFAVAATVIVLLAAGVLFNALDTGKSSVDVQQLANQQVQPEHLFSYENNIVADEPVASSAVHVPVEMVNDNVELEVLASEDLNTAVDQPVATSSTADADSIVVSTEKYDELKRVSSEQDVFFTAMEYRLLNGDSLWRLAKKHYIDPFYWPHIYQANHNKINNPDKVKIGKTVTLPTLYGTPDALTQQDKHNIAMGYYYNYLYHKEKGNPYAYFSLIGVDKFDPSLLTKFKGEIERLDVSNLALLIE
ncbi:MAG: HU family DNA-binding protein [Gammaproteobacteria bacterium]|nr:HU family DNA-binding protein [Gammaproteobacteria bacterium]